MTVVAMATCMLALPTVASADQLMCNRRAVAEAAATMLPEGAIVLDFCSKCEDRVRVVRVKSAAAVEGCNWELEIAGRVVWESTRPIQEGQGVRMARYRRDKSRYLRRLDLAYAYAEVAPNDFRWIGGLLGQSADVAVDSMRLPPIVSASLGRRPMAEVPAEIPQSGPEVTEEAVPVAPAPKAAKEPEPETPAAPPEPMTDVPKEAPSAPEAPVAEEAPSAEAVAPVDLTASMVRTVFDYWRNGEKEPVLAHFMACLKLDLNKKSRRRFECLKPVEGPVKQGTQVYGWADWLVPRDVKKADIALEFVFGGKVRLRRKLPVRGRARSPVVPTTVGARLSRRGIYTLRVIRGDDILREIEVEVR